MLRAMGLRDIDPRLECESVEEAAALGLLALMKGISEDYWCAGWLMDLEFDLWQTVVEPSDKMPISERERSLLRLLSEECQGWWAWDESSGAPTFLSLADWNALVSSISRADILPVRLDFQYVFDSVLR